MTLNIRAFATDLDKQRRRGLGRRPQQVPRRALHTRKCSSSRRSRVQNAPLESRMHISTTRRPVAVVADRGGGPARTTTRPSARAMKVLIPLIGDLLEAFGIGLILHYGGSTGGTKSEVDEEMLKNLKRF